MPHPETPHFTDILSSLQDLGQDTGINVGGGFNDSLIALAEEDLATQQQSFQQGFGLDLLQQLIGVQNNPFSIVTALQAYGAAGGGTLGPAQAFDATGGAGAPSPYGNLVDELLKGLSAFALGSGVPGEGGAPGADPGVDPDIPPGFGDPGPDNPLNDPVALLEAVTANTITALKGYDPSTPLEATALLSQLTQLIDAGFTTIGGVPIEAVLDLITRAMDDPKSTDPQEVLTMIAKISGGSTNDTTAAPTTGTGAEDGTTTAGDFSGSALNQVFEDFMAGKLSLKGGTKPGEIATALGAAVDQILHSIPVTQYRSIEWLTTLWEARNLVAAGQLDGSVVLMLQKVGLTSLATIVQKAIVGDLEESFGPDVTSTSIEGLLRILGNPFVSPPVAPGNPYPAPIPTVPGPTGLPESPGGVPIHPGATAL